MNEEERLFMRNLDLRILISLQRKNAQINERGERESNEVLEFSASRHNFRMDEDLCGSQSIILLYLIIYKVTKCDVIGQSNEILYSARFCSLLPFFFFG